MTRKTLILAAAAVVTAFALGTGAGAASSPAPAPAAAPSPAPTVTKTVTKPVEKIIEKTPATCLRALDYGDQAFDVAGQSFDTIAKLLAAIGEYDLAEAKVQSEALGAYAPKLRALGPRYQAAKADCRAAK